jgi:hypothetical protein
MNGKIRSVFFICLGLLFGMSVMYVYRNFIEDKKEQSGSAKKETVSYGSTSSDGNSSVQVSIDQLTEEGKR